MDESKDVRVSYSDEESFDTAIVELIKLCFTVKEEFPFLKVKAVKHYSDVRVPIHFIEVYLKDTRSL